jgi:hypothetical protein
MLQFAAFLTTKWIENEKDAYDYGAWVNSVFA